MATDRLLLSCAGWPPSQLYLRGFLAGYGIPRACLPPPPGPVYLQMTPPPPWAGLWFWVGGVLWGGGGGGGTTHMPLVNHQQANSHHHHNHHNRNHNPRTGSCGLNRFRSAEGCQVCRGPLCGRPVCECLLCRENAFSRPRRVCGHRMVQPRHLRCPSAIARLSALFQGLLFQGSRCKCAGRPAVAEPGTHTCACTGDIQAGWRHVRFADGVVLQMLFEHKRYRKSHVVHGWCEAREEHYCSIPQASFAAKRRRIVESDDVRRRPTNPSI